MGSSSSRRNAPARTPGCSRARRRCLRCPGRILYGGNLRSTDLAIERRLSRARWRELWISIRRTPRILPRLWICDRRRTYPAVDARSPQDQLASRARAHVGARTRVGLWAHGYRVAGGSFPPLVAGERRARARPGGPPGRILPGPTSPGPPRTIRKAPVARGLGLTRPSARSRGLLGQNVDNERGEDSRDYESVDTHRTT